MAESTVGRERLGSRLGFILVSAGCAIGLGNIWRFPYITGQYGGAAFVLLYLLFLAIFALPVLIVEFTVGRASQKGIARCFDTLEPKGTKWHHYKWFGLAGNYLLMMFYTVVAGWMLAYCVFSITGAYDGADSAAASALFSGFLADPGQLIFYMFLIVIIGIACTFAGVQKGVERVTKVMMVALFALLLLLSVHSFFLEGAEEGFKFYLLPDFGKLFQSPEFFTEAVFAAMSQSFFTLSIGIGSMEIFGSYIGRDRRLTGEAVRVAGLDTCVALLAGFIIFPACFAYGVQPDSGPSLVFITLPSVFAQMPGGDIWGALFFLFMSFAALSTVIAVFENIMSFTMDQWGTPRKKACIINGILLLVLSIPCALGFNVWSGVTIPGIGDIQSIEDFIVSYNLLPLGSLFFLLFCTRKLGWGFDNFLAEVDAGDKGMRFPRWAAGYMKYVLPVLMIIVFIAGWIPYIQKWMGLA